MDLLNHDLAHEFPQHLEKMRALKASDAHFAKLFNAYDTDNHAVKNYETGAAVISDEALEVLKKQRLQLKDEIYQRLQRP
ncbi:MAG: DUF465 domain-containing protein [Chitinophagaceae bacterium]|nr:DUF465 domain-containing protein [Polaromonas sp.]